MSKRTVRNDIHAGFLGFYLDFARQWWKRPGRSEAIDRAHGVMDGISGLGMRVVDFFTFVSDWTAENRYISGMEPWKRKRVGTSSRPFDFENPRPKFYKCYEKFCELLLEHHLRPCATLLLRPPYLHTLMGNNVQGIRSYADPFFLEYISRLNVKIGGIESEVFGYEYGQWRKISNEWSHHDHHFGHTRCDRGHFVADFHQNLWYRAMKDIVLPHKHVIDITASEFAKAYFSQPSVCPYCDEAVYDDPALRGIPGDPDGVRVMLEQHGYSVPANLDVNAEDPHDREQAENFLGFLFDNPHVQKIRYHEDGGGGETANGYAVGRFKISDNEQAYEFAKILWTMAKSAGKRVVYAPFPLETLVRESDGEYREDYRFETINWERLQNIVTAYGEVYDG